MNETTTAIREGDKATIIQHCSVMGRMEREVRKFRVGDPERWAQHPVSISVAFVEPRKRNKSFYRITPDNIRYLTIEVKGHTVYDSRCDVPCDMDEWEATYQKHHAQWLEEKARNDEFMARHPGAATADYGNFER